MAMESCVLIPGHGHGIVASRGIYRGNLVYGSATGNPNPNPNPNPNTNTNTNPNPNPNPNLNPQASHWAAAPTRGTMQSSRCATRT